ncbi:hypothetical protein [Peribacillus asahii]|uniref:hypothetical protein n=1 Tax=Peribacillus asahii TaxID=228899 RepID=UPI002079345E|nr:hypothetical protein [Peribacillus asahii]USK71259.1 hypothetical protein LIS76_05710 [Peribacillus asahii]
MENKLKQLLDEALRNFNILVSSINDGTRNVPIPSGFKPVEVTFEEIERAKRIIFDESKSDFKEDMVKHFRQLENLIPFCSSPKAFKTAWDMRTSILSSHDMEIITNEGGQFIPHNTNISNVFNYGQRGNVLGTNRRLVFAIRHSEGHYDDVLDDLGRFTYQPQNDTKIMLRYRLAQHLSKELELPYLLLAVMWFRYSVNEKVNYVFMISPVKVIDFENDLLDLDSSLHAPLTLQLITRAEAKSICNRLLSLNQTDSHVETRYELPRQLAREWAYDKINATEKGRQIKRWAQATGMSCPGIKCKKGPLAKPKILFSELSFKEIAFGHIISQNWAKAYSYLLDKVNHPDNLYLTCRICNSSLGDHFPDDVLRSEIVNNGTIGDWLRQHGIDIRNS